MSLHLHRKIRIMYSPVCDVQWKPEFMSLKKLYTVYAYENGILKRKDNTTGEAFYFHFVGDGSRPARLMSNNAIVVPDGVWTKNGIAVSDDEIIESITSQLHAAPEARNREDAPF